MSERQAEYTAGTLPAKSQYTGGWRVRRVYFDGRPSEVDPLTEHGRNRVWCRRYLKNLYGETDPGDCEYSIEPIRGWTEVQADPLAAILYHVAAGDLTAEAGLAEIRALIQASDGNPAQSAGGESATSAAYSTSTAEGNT